jgi:hypothetical protein
MGENDLAVGQNAGAGNFTFMEATANGTGGTGGDGGFGGIAGTGTPDGTAGADGDGGAGGFGNGGTAGLEVRGGTVFVTGALLTANAVGGDGGVSPTGPDGAGGDAESDEAYVLVTNRVGNTALRGRLNAGTITGEVSSTGGSGSSQGISAMEGGSFFFVINGNARIGSVDFNITADEQINDLATDMIEVINSDVRVANGFTFNTDGVLSVYANNGNLNADSFTASASNFIHDELRATPAIFGTISANSFSFTTGQDLIIDAHLNSASDIDLFAPGLIEIQNASAAGSVILEAGDSIDFGDINADVLDFEAGGAVTGGNIIAGTEATGEAGGAVTLGNIDVGITREGGASEDGFAVGISSATSILVGDVDADEAIGFATFGNLTTGDLNAGTDVMTLIGGDTSIASITTGSGGRTYHGDAQMFIDAGGPDDFDPSDPSFDGPPIQSGGSFTVTGTISTGSLTVGAASISTGDIEAFDSAFLDAAGSVDTGNIDTGLLTITAGTDISTGDIFAFGGVDMDAEGSILTGDIAAGSIDLLAGDDITTGDLTTQIFQLLDGGIGTLLFPGASITLEAGGDISTGDISSIDGVYLNAGGSILTGDIFAFDFVEAHAGTSLTTDDIDAGDYVLLTAGTDLTAINVGGGDISATAGGTATVDGTWSAGDVEIISNDIDIAAGGGIFAGDINLVSINGAQTVVGDGVGGGGYQLSDAEYDRLHSNDINVIADTALGAAPNMLIGDLTVDGSDGEAIHDYEFVTYDSEGEVPTGSIRVVGDAVFSNMGTEQSVTFTTNTFELDAATGQLSLEQGPGVLGGQLFLDAAHIHVASGEILDQLADDPQYDGYQDDLNAPAEVQRPDGVIRAASIEIEFEDGGPAELNTLYVQNSGTAEVPAGFVIGGESLFGEGNEVPPPPGSIDLIINGQIVTEGGTLTGIDVRDALVEAEGDISPFTENSTINGCLLVGPCVAEPPEPPFPPDFTPTPGIQDEVDLIDDGVLPPPPFGNEDFIDDNIDTAEGATSPIQPPVPLFDTSSLGDQGDVDDPVSGSGNPALMETPACPTEESQAGGQCKQGDQP